MSLQRFANLAHVIVLGAVLAYLVVVSQLFMVAGEQVAVVLRLGNTGVAVIRPQNDRAAELQKITHKNSGEQREYLPLVQWIQEDENGVSPFVRSTQPEDIPIATDFLLLTPATKNLLRGELFHPRLRLPDLQTLDPTDLRLVSLPSTGRRLVRFSNHIWNAGPGPLELHSQQDQNGGDHQDDHEGHDHLDGQMPTDGESHIVTQHVFDDRGEVVLDNVIGEYIFHPAHAHWHLDSFAIYEVWSIDENGDLRDKLSTSGKISYCVTDTRTVSRELAGDTPIGRQTYGLCYRDVQGLSVNWVDTYAYHLPDQWVEVTDLPEGVYALVSTADPENRILEANEKNNRKVIYIQVEQWRVSEVSPSTLEVEKDP